jgi:tRNA-specific 2-thiouridylase
LAISGRSRKIQIALAEKRGISDYPSPAGGCLLTDKNFSERFRDYLRFSNRPSLDDVPLLKVGRHFRLENGDKVIVARDSHEGCVMQERYQASDHLLIPEGFSGPVVILQGGSLDTALEKMVYYTKKTIPSGARICHWHKGMSRIIPLDTGYQTVYHSPSAPKDNSENE